MRWFVPSVVALTLISSVALADPDKGGARGLPGAPGHGEQSDKAGGKKGDGGLAESGKDGGRESANDDDDEEEVAGQGGHSGVKEGHEGHEKVKGRRTTAQMNFRREHWERSAKSIEAVVHKGNKHITEEERELIHRHDRQVMRLLRIRELAEEEKAEATVKRVDADLERVEKNAQTKLEKLNASAPGGGK